MTLTSTTNRSSHTGDNSTDAFSYSFKIFANTEVDVYLDGVLKTLTTHYTVSGVDADAGGTITFGTAPGTGVAIVFVRDIAQTQTTDYTVTGQINPQTIEDALDKLTMRNQKSQLNVDESFGFADAVTDAGTVRISETAANRASKILSFDSSGGLAADQEIGTHTGNWAASTAYVLRDIVKDTNNNNIYICIVAHTSSGSVPISSNTDAAKWRLIVDAATVATSAAAAATSATASATSATASATSATAAATSATSSATSATSSATSATSSATSATSSATSATSSATSATASASSATAAAASATSAASNAGPHYGVTTGSANTYVLAPNPTLGAYAAGVDVLAKINVANTGASTININSLGVKSIKKTDGTDPASGDLALNGIVELVYDGTNFQLVATGAVAASDLNWMSSSITTNTVRILEQHGVSAVHTTAGVVDEFESNTDAETIIGASASTNETYDASSDFYQQTAGATSQTSDIPYTTESNYTQKEESGTSTATISGDTVTLSSGTFGANVVGARFSVNNFSNEAGIITRTDSTHVELESGHGLSASGASWKIRFIQFAGGVAKLADSSVSSTTAGNDSNTLLLLHFTGSDASTTITDSSSASPTHTVTAVGNAQIDTAQSKFGGSSLLLDGTGDNLTIPDHANWLLGGGSGNFTIDFWWRPAVVNAQANFVGQQTDNNNKWRFFWDDGGPAFRFLQRTGGGVDIDHNPSFTASVDTWYHVALVKNSNEYKIYVGGTLQGSGTTDATSITDYSGVLVIGNDSHAPASAGLNGHLDEFRISDVARWTTNFTPQTTAYGVTASSTANVITEDTCIVPAFAQLTNVSAWADYNSIAVTETLNSQTIKYAFIWGPVGMTAYNDADTLVTIFNQTGSVWKKALNWTGTQWQYNSDTNNTTATSWTNSTSTTDFPSALAQALETNAALAMTGTQAAAITDAEFEAAGGFNAATHTQYGLGAVLKSTNNAQNPQVDLIRTNYDADNAALDLRTKQWNGSAGMPSAPSSVSTMYIFGVDNAAASTWYYTTNGSDYTEISSWDDTWTYSSGKTARQKVVTGLSGTDPRLKVTTALGGAIINIHAMGLQVR